MLLMLINAHVNVQPANFKGLHNVEKCRNLFEELRPDGWVVNEHYERRCQQYLKTAEWKALYASRKSISPLTRQQGSQQFNSFQFGASN
ncbi:hypothetical protein V8E54_000124 [Elaphomyces granulatus]